MSNENLLIAYTNLMEEIEEFNSEYLFLYNSDKPISIPNTHITLKLKDVMKDVKKCDVPLKNLDDITTFIKALYNGWAGTRVEIEDGELLISGKYTAVKYGKERDEWIRSKGVILDTQRRELEKMLNIKTEEVK